MSLQSVRIYKSFLKPNSGYGDIVYDQPSNDAFSSQTIQYNATFTGISGAFTGITIVMTIAIAGAIKDTSCEKLHQEIGLEYLQKRRWMRRLCLFYKVVSTKIPDISIISFYR